MQKRVDGNSACYKYKMNLQEVFLALLLGTALSYPQEDHGLDWSSLRNLGFGLFHGPTYDKSEEYKPRSVSDGCRCVPPGQCEESDHTPLTAAHVESEKDPVNSNRCGPYLHLCCPSSGRKTNNQPSKHQCGTKTSSDIKQRILPSSRKLGQADFGEWPWQAVVLKFEGNVNIFQCGGTLIDKFHVLTIAHCVHEYASSKDHHPLKVRLGEWDTQSHQESIIHQDYGISNIYIHPKYDHERKNLRDDIAILKLDKEVSFGSHINPICLPYSEEKFEGLECVVTGWGKDAYKNGSYSNILKEVLVPVLNNARCQELLRETRLGKLYQLYDGFICAGGQESEDSCKGDGGGPLSCWRRDGTYGLAGIVSWGINCGDPGVPGVYIRIQKYIDWITDITNRPITDFWPNLGIFAVSNTFGRDPKNISRDQASLGDLEMKFLALTVLLGISWARPQDDRLIWGSAESDVSRRTGNDNPEGPNPNKNYHGCLCVPFYLCKDDNIIIDGSGILDPRNKPPPTAEPHLNATLAPAGANGCGPFHVCCTLPETTTKTPFVPHCGFRNINGINKRILNTKENGLSQFGEWPWQAAVLKVEGKVNIFQCGAVLIDNLHLLTVAHCVYRFTSGNDYHLKVRLGEWDTQNTEEFYEHEDHDVGEIIIHPKYDDERKNLWDDIAILRLKSEVSLKPHIDTICLPNFQESFEDVTCVVTGWGKDAYKNGTYSNILREVIVPVIHNSQCEQLLKKTRLGRHFTLYEKFICAGGEKKKDSCKGDGGGPLVCWSQSGRYKLAGIVSWGINCGMESVPGVYVRVQNYIDWITSITNRPIQSYWPEL
ncbi:ovochymase-1-like [Tachypleus tridentatus]|uniref:ovochymase-1-like n=1 Tax=Tachypleus tridentatus TaxID=6853 RepID=UPI003FD0D70C